MHIDLETIPPEGLSIQEQEPAGILKVKDKDIEFKVPIDLSIIVNLVSGTLLVQGNVETKANLVCARCLKKYQFLLINENFNFELDVRGLTDVDITDNIRQGIIELLPIKPLCKSDCHGLCPKCGQDLNEKDCGCDKGHEEIRWKDLDKLKLKRGEYNGST